MSLPEKAHRAHVTERPDEANSRGLSRAKGLAEAIAQARSYPVDMDGVREVAAEIVTLLDGAARLPERPDDRLREALLSMGVPESEVDAEVLVWVKWRENVAAVRPERPDEGTRDADYERFAALWPEVNRQAFDAAYRFGAAARLPERPDEDPMPVFTIQGKDLLAAPVITYYQRQVEGLLDGGQAHEVELARQEIEAWQKRNPDRCKYPDHRHVPVEADR